MKKTKIILFLSILIILAVILSRISRPGSQISESQQETINLFGDPPQFVLTYLPQQSESGQDLARYEIWYYPEVSKKITFLAGKIIDSQDFESADEMSAVSFQPWDFDIFTSYQELVDVIGDRPNLVDLPGFSGEDLKTYATEEGVFIIEGDYLTYVQTLTYDEDVVVVEEEKPAPTLEKKEEELLQGKEYSNSDIGFSIIYPDSWFLQNGVLTNYDTDYLFSGAELPEEMIKCDFLKYYQEDFQLKDKKQIENGDVTISQAMVDYEEDTNTIGYGDNVVFLFEDSLHQPISLVCFRLDQNLEDELINTIKTFQFLD